MQLSLLETIEPLVIDIPNRNRLFSPWKDERRNVHGLVHGVYVFGNLRCFWECIAAQLTANSSFAEARVEEIDNELKTVQDLANNPTLTTTGRRLATSLLGSP